MSDNLSISSIDDSFVKWACSEFDGDESIDADEVEIEVLDQTGTTVAETVENMSESGVSVPNSDSMDVGTVVDDVDIHRRRRWLVTGNNYVFHGARPRMDADWIGVQVKTMSAQYEIGACGTRHFHCFVEFLTPRSFKTVKKIFMDKTGCESVHLAYAGHMHSDLMRCVKYCNKEDTRDCELDLVVCWFRDPRPTDCQDAAIRAGCPKKDQRRRNVSCKDRLYDLLYVKNPLTKSWDEVFDGENAENRALMLQNIHWKAERVRQSKRLVTPKKIEQVVVLWGASGTGKTSFVHNSKDLFDCDQKNWLYLHCRSQGKWFDYNEEDVILFDEFSGCSGLTLEQVLGITDVGKQGPRVQKKGGLVQLNHRVVVFTSNLHPRLWYNQAFSSEPERWHAFARRVTKCFHVPAIKPDGASNRWHEGSTEMWKTEENLLLFDVSTLTSIYDRDEDAAVAFGVNLR